MDNEDRSVVTVADEEAAPQPKNKERVGTAQLLEAIRGIPAAVAAQVKGGPAPAAGGGSPEVTFVGEAPPPEPDKEDDEPVGPGAPTPDPAVHRPAFRHSSARRRRVEAML